jgi:hypothetical protein
MSLYNSHEQFNEIPIKIISKKNIYLLGYK